MKFLTISTLNHGLYLQRLYLWIIMAALISGLYSPQVRSQEILGICDRTSQVVTEVLNRLSNISACANVSAAHLQSLTGTIDLWDKGIQSLKSGDFAGMTNLTGVRLGRNSLTQVPADLLQGLTKLTYVNLCHNNLTSLPPLLFQDQPLLTIVYIFDNQMTSIPIELFAKTTKLDELWLHQPGITTLPSNLLAAVEDIDGLQLVATGTSWPVTDLEWYLDSETQTYGIRIDHPLPVNVSINITATNTTLDNSTLTIPKGQTTVCCVAPVPTDSSATTVLTTDNVSFAYSTWGNMRLDSTSIELSCEDLNCQAQEENEQEENEQEENEQEENEQEENEEAVAYIDTVISPLVANRSNAVLQVMPRISDVAFNTPVNGVTAWNGNGAQLHLGYQSAFAMSDALSVWGSIDSFSADSALSSSETTIQHYGVNYHIMPGLKVGFTFGLDDGEETYLAPSEPDNKVQRIVGDGNMSGFYMAYQHNASSAGATANNDKTSNAWLHALQLTLHIADGNFDGIIDYEQSADSILLTDRNYVALTLSKPLTIQSNMQVSPHFNYSRYEEKFLGSQSSLTDVSYAAHAVVFTQYDLGADLLIDYQIGADGLLRVQLSGSYASSSSTALAGSWANKTVGRTRLGAKIHYQPTSRLLLRLGLEADGLVFSDDYSATHSQVGFHYLF